MVMKVWGRTKLIFDKKNKIIGDRISVLHPDDLLTNFQNT